MTSQDHPTRRHDDKRRARFNLSVTLWQGPAEANPEWIVTTGVGPERAVVGHWRACNGNWTAGEITDVMTTIHSAVVAATVITSGLQLALDPEG
jgi:hypothetical protein